jgi:hypothetical protein
MKGQLWTLDEAVYLVGVFFKSEFKNGDDSNPLCREIARTLNRTPSSIDRQWRNIQDVRMGLSHSNVGRVIIQTTLEYVTNPRVGHKLALEAAVANRWPLTFLGGE